MDHEMFIKDERIKELEGCLQWTKDIKDAEISKLKARIRELEGVLETIIKYGEYYRYLESSKKIIEMAERGLKDETEGGE